MTLWLSKKLVLAAQHALTSTGEGRVASVGLGKLSKALRTRGLDIEDLNEASKPENRAPENRAPENRAPECRAPQDREHDLPGRAVFTAILVEDIATRSDWAQELSRLRALLMPSGRLVSVDRGAPAEVSRRFLCGGLSDLSQLEVGRQVLTSGTSPAQ